MKVGRVLGTAVLGLLLMLFVALDLLVFGVIPLNSALITGLPLAGWIVGGVLGGLASRRTATFVTPAAAVPPAATTLPPPPPPPPPPPG